MLWLSLVSPTPRTERMLSPTWNQTMHEQKLSSKLKNNSLVEMFEIPLRLYQQDVYIHCIDRKLNCWRVGMPTISLYLNTINDAIDFINLHSFFPKHSLLLYHHFTLLSMIHGFMAPFTRIILTRMLSRDIKLDWIIQKEMHAMSAIHFCGHLLHHV